MARRRRRGRHPGPWFRIQTIDHRDRVCEMANTPIEQIAYVIHERMERNLRPLERVQVFRAGLLVEESEPAPYDEWERE